MSSGGSLVDPIDFEFQPVVHAQSFISEGGAGIGRNRVVFANEGRVVIESGQYNHPCLPDCLLVLVAPFTLPGLLWLSR